MNRNLLRSTAHYLAVLLPGLLLAALLGTAALAITAKEKRETCTFGATHQNLTGAQQKAFIAKCMANEPGKAKKKSGEKKKEDMKQEKKQEKKKVEKKKEEKK